MPDWTPKPTIVIGGVEFRLQYPNLYPDKFMYVEFQPIDRGYKCVLAPSTSLLKLLDGTWLMELEELVESLETQLGSTFEREFDKIRALLARYKGEE